MPNLLMHCGPAAHLPAFQGSGTWVCARQRYLCAQRQWKPRALGLRRAFPAGAPHVPSHPVARGTACVPCDRTGKGLWKRLLLSLDFVPCPFPSAAFVLYPFAEINCSHDHHYVLGLRLNLQTQRGGGFGGESGHRH